jgi:hypothetical protein
MSQPRELLIDPSPALAVTAAVLISLMFVGLAVASNDILRALSGENGIVEIVSALAYPVGAVFAVRLARQSNGWSRAHWILWTALCVLFFGEETSWLQHAIGYKTPESIKAINAQSEFNIHNLNVLTVDQELVGAQGAVSGKAWRDSQVLFYLGFATYFLLLPLARSVRGVDKLAQRLALPRMSGRFLLMVWIPLMVSVVLTFADRSEYLRKAMIGESREMVFALTIMAFITLAYYATRSRSKAVAVSLASAGAPTEP